MSLFTSISKSRRPAGIGTQTGPIGFHLSRDRLHMMQLERHAGGLQLRAGLSCDYPANREDLLASPGEFKSFVKQTLKKGQFRNNEIVTGLPGGVKIINLNYQIEAGQKIEDEIVKSIIYSMGGSPEDYIIDYLPIRSENLTSRNKSVLAMVADREKVIRFLDLFTAAGLHVLAVDVGPASLGRLVASLDFEGKYPHNLLINFANNKSYLSVFDGRRLIMDRELSVGLNHLLEKLAKSLAIDKAHALQMLSHYGFRLQNGGLSDNGAVDHNREIVDSIVEILKPFFLEVSEEVNKMLLYIKSETRGKTIDHIYLLGSMARFPGAEDLIFKIFALPASVLNPLAHIAVTNGRSRHMQFDGPAQIALSVGFALRGMI